MIKNKFFKNLSNELYKNRKKYWCFIISFGSHAITLFLILIYAFSEVEKEEKIINIKLDFSTQKEQEENFENKENNLNEESKSYDLPKILPNPIKDKINFEEMEKKLPDLNSIKEQIDDIIEQSDKEYKETLDSFKTSKQSSEENDILEKMELRKNKLSSSKIIAKEISLLRGIRKKEMIEKEGGSKQTEEAVNLGLDWLKRHQDIDGKWDAINFDKHCKEEKCLDKGSNWHNIGITGLALLAFLGDGNSLTEGKFKKQVLKAVNYLIEMQTVDGCYGAKRGNYMYCHAIATFAIAEAYMMSKNQKILNSLNRGLNFLIEAQNEGLAWRYRARSGSNDTSVTGWCVLALKAATYSELTIPKNTITNARNWFDKVTMQGEEPWVGYTSASIRNYCMTSVGVTFRIFFEEENDKPFIMGGASILSKNLPRWSRKNNFYYWYYGTLSMYQIGGQFWKDWNNALKNALLTNQEKQGCKKGSWGSGHYKGSRVYWTALNVLSLQVYYRYPRIYD